MFVCLGWAWLLLMWVGWVCVDVGVGLYGGWWCGV